MAIDISTISEEEKEFVQQYTVKLNKLQSRIANGVLYSKLTMSYCLQNELCFLNLAFHPETMAIRTFFEKNDYSDLNQVFEAVILYELDDENESWLLKDELQVAIKHFREIQADSV